MATIAVLMAMLLPSLKRSMDFAKTTVCMHHLRELGHAMELYRMENDGWLPSDARHGDELQRAVKRDQAAWFQTLIPTYLSDPIMLTCPMDPYRYRMIEARNDISTPQVTEFASYGLNDFIATAADGVLADVGRHQPTRPMDTIVLADMGPDTQSGVDAGSAGKTVGPPRNASRLTWGDGSDPYSPIITTPWLTMRHGNGINMLTLGGGVRAAKTSSIIDKPVMTYYVDCAAGGCTICNQTYGKFRAHYTFAKDRLFWWTGPAPVE